MRKLAVLVAFFVTPISSYADYCDYSRDYDFSVDAGALERLLLDVVSGNLSIVGDPDSQEVRVVAKACASSSRRLNELDLGHRVQGSDLLIRTELDGSFSFFSWLNFGRSGIDINITMPEDLYLEVDDGSGGIEIQGVSDLVVNDGSGSVSIANIAGNVAIGDGSGAISISDVRGTVSINDGSGPISIRDSHAVTIIGDGSGGILIENISGNVTIVDDGSGSIRVHEVGGDVALGDTGSGSVAASGVVGSYSANAQ